MSECYLAAEGPCTCDNCDWTGDAAKLEMIRDIELRLDPGGTVPAGQCPECDGLAYLDDRINP